MTIEVEAVRAMGATTEERAVQADLERYQHLALEPGASAAAIVPASDVAVDERVRLKCTVPRCVRAGETPNCPPYAPSLDLVRQALQRYHYGVLFKCGFQPLEDYAPDRRNAPEAKQRLLSFHERTGTIVYELERQAYRDGYYLAMGFGGGSCKDYLCKGQICQYLDGGRCRFPHRARPAMEAVGIDVVDLVRKVGWGIYALMGDLRRVPCAISVGIVFVN